MIALVFQAGRSFRAACGYVAQDLQRAVVLGYEGVRGRDYRLMGQDFEIQHRLRPEVEKPVFHAMLSFPTGEDPGDGRSLALAREWMEAIGMSPTQVAIVKHIDTAHVHLHILANRISNKGIIVGTGMVIERGMKAAKMLTRKYGLQIEERKSPALTNRAALKSVDALRYRLYDAIRVALESCGRLDELEARLLGRGITTRYRLDRGTGARVGISFRIEGYAFKGSGVDEGFSLRGLERQLAERRLSMKQAEEGKEVVGGQQIGGKRLENVVHKKEEDLAKERKRGQRLRK